MDFQVGPGVDLLLSDPYVFPLEDENCDVVLSSSCFEHSEFFWLTFLEALRILKPHGLLYINAPSTGTLWIAGAFIQILESLFASGQD